VNHRRRREHWLHARISEDLQEALKREARRRRSPVSLVVRNVLEGALNLVEDIVEDSLEVARRSRRLARAVRDGPAALDDIYGWQELILNRPGRCARCEADLTVGTSAHRGLREDPGGSPVFLCAVCLRWLRQHGQSNDDEQEG
jgi:hypothetical protein